MDEFEQRKWNYTAQLEWFVQLWFLFCLWFALSWVQHQTQSRQQAQENNLQRVTTHNISSVKPFFQVCSTIVYGSECEWI